MMAAGRLRCLGSAQHLKGRFGQGYVLDVKVAGAGAGGRDLHSSTFQFNLRRL